MPKISIVTPSFNRAELLKRLWKSISTQNVDFEWIVVDDGSVDATVKVVSEFQDPRIVFRRLEKNMGVNCARNAGIKLATANYLIFLDSDDELVSNSLAAAIEKLETTTRDIGVACFACVMAETGKQTSKLIDGSIFGEKDIVCDNVLRGGDNAYIYKKEIFDEFKLPEDLKGCEHVFVYAISKKWKFIVFDMPVTLVHRQLDNLSGAASLVARSKDIAKSYEIILHIHEAILQNFPAARAAFYRKCIYRYGVAGARTDVLRLTFAAIKNAPLKEILKTFALTVISLFPVANFELWRISRINRKLEGKAT